MANELRLDYVTGKTVYTWIARAADGQVYKGSASFEAINGANWATYVVTTSEQSSTGMYYGNMPGSLPVGWYDVFFRLQAGGSPATTDTPIGKATVYWTGSVDSTAIAQLGATTINSNVGTTQPVNFTGTAGSALVKVDVQDFGGAAGTFSGGKPAVKLTNTDVTGNVAADLQTIAGSSLPLDANSLLNVNAQDLGGHAVSLDANNLPYVTAKYDSQGNLLIGKVFLTGTAGGGSSTTITLASGTGVEKGMLIRLYANTGAGQTRVITNIAGTNCTVDRAWRVNPDNTTVYAILTEDRGSCTVAALLDANITTTLGTPLNSTAGYVGIDWSHVNAPSSTVNLSGTTVATLSGSVGGDIAGKVLGGGGSTITAIGTWAADSLGGTLVTDVIATGTAQAGSGFANSQLTVTSATGVSSGTVMELYSGNSSGDRRTVTNYVSGTTLLPDRNFTAALNSNTKYVLRRANEFAMINAAINWAADGNGYPEVDSINMGGRTVQLDANGYLEVDVFSINNQAITTTGTITFGTFVGNANALLGVTAAGKVTEVALCDTLTTYTNNTPQSGDNYARLGAPAGASVSADVASVKTSVGSVTGAVGSVTGNVGGNIVGNVQGKVLGGGAGVITAIGVWGADGTGHSWTYTAPTNVTAAAMASAVWKDTTASDFTQAGSIGLSLAGAFTSLGSSTFTVGALANAPSGGGGGGTSNPLLLSQDTFGFDPAGTEVAQHVPDVGPLWVDSGGTSFALDGKGNVFYNSANNGDCMYLPLGSGDHAFQVKTNFAGNTTSDIGFTLRGPSDPFHAAPNSGWTLILRRSNGHLELYDAVDYTTPVSSTPFAFDNTGLTTYSVHGYALGTAISFTVFAPGIAPVTIGTTSSKYQSQTRVALWVGLLDLSGGGKQTFREWKSYLPIVNYPLAATYVGDPGNAESIWSDSILGSDFAVSGSIGQALASALPRITGGQISIVSNLSATGTITIAHGSDNYAVDGRSIDLVAPRANYWPNLAGATVTLYLDRGAVAIVGNVVTAIGNQVVRFEPSAAVTLLLQPGTHKYAAWATLASGHQIELAAGTANILESQRNN